MSIPVRARWALVVAWMAVIFWFSAQANSGETSGAIVRQLAALVGASLSVEDSVWWHHLLRKGAHFTEYAILSALTGWALPPGPRRWAFAWAIATAYAATDETHQAFVPNRGPALKDVGIDSTGAGAAALLAWLASRRR